MEEINIKIDDNNDSKNAEKNIWIYATIIIIAILIPVLIIFCGTDSCNSNS
ncbi:MAG: hypothetical protein J6Q51_04200 [Clostridia bacterium]|nr:hypothetical protein [Clostridia bacterium]